MQLYGKFCIKAVLGDDGNGGQQHHGSGAGTSGAASGVREGDGGQQHQRSGSGPGALRWPGGNGRGGPGGPGGGPQKLR